MALLSRRRVLRLTGVGTLLSVAGCLGSGADPSGGGYTAPRAPIEGAPAYRDVDLPIPREAFTRGAARDAIPAIVDPAFASDWADIGPTLDDTERVIGVDAGQTPRAYPLAVLNWHEVVNDVLPTADGDRPLLVTYCPLCGSGVVADRSLGGPTPTFGVSGLLYESDLVMYDTATESLWSQVLAQAVRGPLTGTELPLIPNTLATWGEWREAHPNTEVLLPPPASDTVVGPVERDYEKDPYYGYQFYSRVGIGANEDVDERLPAKVTVLGIAHDGAATAYPTDAVIEAGVVVDRVGGLPVVVTATDEASLFAYVRRVDGEELTFEREGDTLVGGGSRWDLTSGRALDGPHEGTTLARANDRSPMFWFAWADFYPDTEVWRGS